MNVFGHCCTYICSRYRAHLLLGKLLAFLSVKIYGNSSRDHPANRPCEPDADSALCQVGQEKCQNHPQKQVCKSGRHELAHSADTPENAVSNQLCGHDEIEGGQNPQELSACQHSCSRISFHEQEKQILSEEDIQGTERYTQAPYHFDACPETVLKPAVFSGAQILRREIGNAVSDCGKGSDDQIVQLYGGGVSGHDGGAEAVDNTLDQDVSYGDKALLENARYGNYYNLFQQTAVKQGRFFLAGNFFQPHPYGQHRQNTAYALT